MSFRLNASYDDPDPSLGLSFYWTQVSGPGSSTFDDRTILAPSVTVTANGTYTYKITATHDPAVSSDEVKVVVNGSMPPAASLNGLIWYLPCLAPHSYSTCSCSNTPVVVNATMNGTPGQLYDVAFLFRGVAEINAYAGGSRSGMFYTGGSPSGANNQYRLEVSDPAGTYWLNAADVQIDGYCFLVNYSATIQIRTGASVTLTADATDTGQYFNQDVTLTPITVPDTYPDHPIGVTQPFDGQFIQMDVISITAV